MGTIALFGIPLIVLAWCLWCDRDVLMFDRRNKPRRRPIRPQPSEYAMTRVQEVVAFNASQCGFARRQAGITKE